MESCCPEGQRNHQVGYPDLCAVLAVGLLGCIDTGVGTPARNGDSANCYPRCWCVVRSRPSDCVHCPHEEIQKEFVFPQHGYWGVIDSCSAQEQTMQVVDTLLSLGLFYEYKRVSGLGNGPNQRR